MKSKSLAGICGIYCGTCPIYLARKDNDIEELEKIAQTRRIPIDDIMCDGCLSGHIATFVKCDFRSCSTNKKVTWCFQCDEFPCERLVDFTDADVIEGVSHHARVIDNLKEMKEFGVDEWLKREDRRGRCPQCNKKVYWYLKSCPKCGKQLKR